MYCWVTVDPPPVPPCSWFHAARAMPVMSNPGLEKNERSSAARTANRTCSGTWSRVTLTRLTLSGRTVASEFPGACPPDPDFPPGPEAHGSVRNAKPAPPTFTTPDAARMVIPGKSSFSLFCHWQTPVSLAVLHNTSGATIQNARFFATPTYTFQNPVLNDPSLINPVTGLPFGGQIVSPALVGIRHQQSLQPGDMVQERDDETRACINGMISKRQLTETYGLTDAQANNFFKQDTAITMGLTIQATAVEFASLVYSTRWLGD